MLFRSDDLGKLARFERDNFKLNRTKFDVSSLSQRIIKTFESDFAKGNKEIVFYGESKDIVADKDKLSQVMVNLISNALKFTKEIGKVEIHVKGSKDITEIIVKDNGIGISNEDLSNVFERFYKTDKSRGAGGAGIGLAIVKSIVLAHDGKIMLNSKIGQGSEFIIRLDRKSVV